MIKKLSIIGVVALATLILGGCSTGEEMVYDITGNWVFTFTSSSGVTGVVNFNFTGTMDNGNATDITRGRTGTYSVNNQMVSIILATYIDSTCGYLTETITGSFISSDTISGSYSGAFDGPCWLMDPWVSWQASRH